MTNINIIENYFEEHFRNACWNIAIIKYVNCEQNKFIRQKTPDFRTFTCAKIVLGEWAYYKQLNNSSDIEKFRYFFDKN